MKIYVDANGTIVGIALDYGYYSINGISPGDDIQSGIQKVLSQGWQFKGNSLDDGLLASVYLKDGFRIHLDVNYEQNRANNSGGMNSWNLTGNSDKYI